jgi:hypothetical protein
VDSTGLYDLIPFVYFLRLKLFDKYVHGIDMEALAAELDYYKNKEKAELDKGGNNRKRSFHRNNKRRLVKPVCPSNPQRISLNRCRRP